MKALKEKTYSEVDTSKCEHTPCPSGFLEWHDWAGEMKKTHKQTACPNCGLWSVWVKKNGD